MTVIRTSIFRFQCGDLLNMEVCLTMETCTFGDFFQCQYTLLFYYMDVSKNSGIPQIIHLIGFSIINHPFWGTTIVGNPYINGFFGLKKKKYSQHFFGTV